MTCEVFVMNMEEQPLVSLYINSIITRIGIVHSYKVRVRIIEVKAMVSNRLETGHSKRKLKKRLLRNNEYYDMQSMFDELYALSKKDNKFRNLMEIIRSEENIKLAFRNIKSNKGSKTPGTDKENILKLGNSDIDEFVIKIQQQLDNYFPKPVRRVLIPKPNGDKRPLGIPTITDRIVQQCIKQVLEPICEAKFYDHSYGFRPNRSTKHAIVRAMSLVNLSKFYYVVDIDIKGFFDNVNHAKLLKQLWSLGIQDKNLICVISKILKSEIEGIGKSEKGTPQGGILSPLLSNVVLNELDWWISSQWETMPTKHNYEKISRGRLDRSHKYRALRNSSELKEMFIVRYADDFKIFCKDFNSASKTLIAVKEWLKNRLGLEINEDKSKVTNLKKNYTEFLGIKFKAKKKKAVKTDYVVQSHITDKAKQKITTSYRRGIVRIKNQPNVDTVDLLNAKILGYHNYYDIATMVNKDFAEIHAKTFRMVDKCLKNVAKENTKSQEIPKTYKKFYGRYNFKTYYIMGKPLYPIAGIKHKSHKALNKEICAYTKKGRELIHKNLNEANMATMLYLMKHPISNRSTEYNDNRISLFIGQNGKCAITQEPLLINNMEVHHITPRNLGGTDEYKNLMYITTDVHILIHAKGKDVINKLIQRIGKLNITAWKKINKLREIVGNEPIAH